MAANCRFVDNFTDFGLLGKVNVPIYKCDPPATNAVWGIQAVQPAFGVLDFGFSGNVGVGSVAKTTTEPAKELKWETCNSDEIDMGLTCNKELKCTTEDDTSQPIRDMFGSVWGFMKKTTCTQPSVRFKKQM